MSKLAPYFYASVRVDLLAITLLSYLAWAVTGWDGTIQQIFGGGSYGNGIHWSTSVTFASFFYILAVNMQIGGLNSFGDLWAAFKFDLWNVLHYWQFFKVRKKYLSFVIDPKGGIAIVFFFTVLGTFVFENAWVLLYNYFEFGNWLWPVYYGQASVLNPNPMGTYIFVRNVTFLLVPLIAGPLAIYMTASGIWQKSHRPIEILWDFHNPMLRGMSITASLFWGIFANGIFKIKWRFDFYWLAIIAVTLSLWGIWVSGVFPHATLPLSQLTPSQVISLNTSANFTLSRTDWIYPAQQFFPQTSYTFYPPQFYLAGYDPNGIYGFWVHDDFIHFLNVTTKYMTFLTVCYPALIKVKKD